jgi:hypothetical protein
MEATVVGIGCGMKKKPLVEGEEGEVVVVVLVSDEGMKWKRVLGHRQPCCWCGDGSGRGDKERERRENRRLEKENGGQTDF